MKLASRMTVNVNYHCLCLQLTMFSGWQLLLNRQGLIVRTWFLFFFLRQCIPLLIKTCTAEVEILSQWLSPKATHSYQAFSAFEIKEFGSESPGFEKKGIPDDLWSQELHTWTVGSWLLACDELASHRKGRAAPLWPCLVQQWLPAA